MVGPSGSRSGYRCRLASHAPGPAGHGLASRAPWPVGHPLASRGPAGLTRPRWAWPLGRPTRNASLQLVEMLTLTLTLSIDCRLRRNVA